MEPVYSQNTKRINRIVIPIEAIDPKNTTLSYAQLQKALKNSKDTVTFLRCLNKTLFILILVAGLYFLYQFFTLDRLPGLVQIAEKASSDGTGKIAVQKGFSRNDFKKLQQHIAKRNIFAPSLTSERARVTARSKVKSEIQQRLSIVGILIDSTPTAIIELNNKTLFVQEGEQVDDIQIKKIDESKITFFYKGVHVDIER